MKNRFKIIISVLLVCTLLSSCAIKLNINPANTQSAAHTLSYSVDELPAYDDKAYVTVNNNIPEFENAEITKESFEEYGELDALGRCTSCVACVGTDIMPTEKRGAIGEVKPTGWHTVKYDCVDGRYLYNRCHLIGYQLTGENANPRNLITGTRYMNVEGMLPFEDEVAEYVKSTKHHVMYRVTPVFKGSELVARGVQMEALSVEDGGKGVSFNVFCYNAQPGIEIDYLTGDSRLINTSATPDTQSIVYVLNTNSKKFHKPSCEHINDIKSENKKEVKTSRSELISKGYKPCGSCNP